MRTDSESDWTEWGLKIQTSKHTPAIWHMKSRTQSLTGTGKMTSEFPARSAICRYKGTPFSAAPALQTARDTPRMALAPNLAVLGKRYEQIQSRNWHKRFTELYNPNRLTNEQSAIILTYICSPCHPCRSSFDQFSLAQPRTRSDKDGITGRESLTAAVCKWRKMSKSSFQEIKIHRQVSFLTWPTSAGAIIELMFSTACETPATERSSVIWIPKH